MQSQDTSILTLKTPKISSIWQLAWSHTLWLRMSSLTISFWACLNGLRCSVRTNCPKASIQISSHSWLASKRVRAGPNPMVYQTLVATKVYIRLKSSHKVLRAMEEAMAWTPRRARNTTVQKRCLTGSEADASLTRILTPQLTNWTKRKLQVRSSRRMRSGSWSVSAE